MSLAQRGRVLSVQHKLKMSIANLGKRHTEETRKKMSLSNRRVFSAEYRRKLSLALRGKRRSLETRRKISLGLAGKILSTEHKHKISEGLRGHRVSLESRRKMAAKKIGSVHSAEHNRNMSEAMKRKWKEPGYAEATTRKAIAASHARPNRSEQSLAAILDSLAPGTWKYVGNGLMVLGGKCPDFVNVNGRKQIIELFGDYWHRLPGRESEAERIAHFRPFGYDTLIVWESELKNESLLRAKLAAFCV